MISFFKKIFSNDWVVVDTYVANWIRYTSYNNIYTGKSEIIKGSEVDMKTFYHIKYSKNKNKFLIFVEGIENKSTQSTYELALVKLSELNKKLLSGIDIKEILSK